jgi:hypothetical protein
MPEKTPKKTGQDVSKSGFMVGTKKVGDIFFFIIVA